MRAQLKAVDRVIAAIASSAHGVVTYAELLAAGISRNEVASRVRHGALIRVYRGVYRVGHQAFSVEAMYMAAVKAAGSGALLCDLPAGHLLGLMRMKPPPPVVAAPRQCRIRGLHTRHVALSPRDRTTHRGIPVTTVPRTLVDLAAFLPPAELGRACHEAGVRYRTTPRQIKAALARRPNAPGAAKLWRIMSGDEPIVLSKLEAGFLERLRAAGLPLPQTNRMVEAGYVDCRWQAPSLIVELDSYRYHASRYAWEQDRRRERRARAREEPFRRYTWADVFEEPGPMLTELHGLLAAAAAA